MQLGIVAEEVIDAFHQRVFRAYDDHIDLVLQHKVLDAVEVIGLQGHVLAHLTGAGVAGSDIEFLNLGRLCDFPCEGVLAAATAE